MLINLKTFLNRLAILFFLGLIVVYQKMISPFLPGSCRFLPTCSAYSKEAFQTHGLKIGLLLTIKRLLKCHPISFLGAGSGHDPVPPKEKPKEKKEQTETQSSAKTDSDIKTTKTK